MTETTEHRLRALLEDAISPTYLLVENESHLHAGHREAGEGGETHFRLTIAADALQGLPLVAQHRAIYRAVDELMNTPIHALAITVLPLS
jgi:BolA family transcriptional regulator, general stress-responsive regulator